jgi:transposase
MRCIQSLNRITDLAAPANGLPKLHADKGYDYPRCRAACRARGIAPRTARRGHESSERLGRHRWVVERTIAWLGRSRRLGKDYERLPASSEALVYLTCIRLLLVRLT